MPTNFKPIFTLNPAIAKHLMRIEAAKAQVPLLPLTPRVLASLRETAKRNSIHYSTQIEGNRLSIDEVKEVLELKGHFPGRERDEREVKGYYAALAQLERYVAQQAPVTERVIQTLHALVTGDGRAQPRRSSEGAKAGQPTPYRDGQNVIKDSGTGDIVYMPPEAQDVPGLMRNLVAWIRENEELPRPIVAAIAHYQFVTIHPYYDGNGRTARLLTTLLLHLGGYDLKGLYSLEEYYARNLYAYYVAMAVGPSHNYYFGRAEADITGWIEYFCEGMAYSFEKVVQQMRTAQHKGKKDYSGLFRTLEPQQRSVLVLLKEYAVITSKQVADLFGYKQRYSSALCKKWVDAGFLKVLDHSNKTRKYTLADKFVVLLDDV